MKRSFFSSSSGSCYDKLSKDLFSKSMKLPSHVLPSLETGLVRKGHNLMYQYYDVIRGDKDDNTSASRTSLKDKGE